MQSDLAARTSDNARLPAAPAWRSEIWFRMRHLFLLKLAGTSVFIWLFFIAYFHLLRHPAQPPMVMPLTPLDHWIPFQPKTLFAYLSLWLYVGVAPGLQRSFRELLVYGVWAVTLCVAGLTVFYLWPTAVPALTIDVSGYPGFAMLQGVDATGNAFPSMHVAIAMFTVIHLESVFRDTCSPALFRWLNFLWFAAIVWSTLAIRQHVVLDVVGGSVLGLLFAWASLRWRPRPLRLSSNFMTERADRPPAAPTRKAP
ncbi:MAG: phosphatase PAP2 family protein [Comamonadaceae bacterium]|nr:MAG: phosphatase PAP2 family protein [Comamonadaceae bacterium]